MGMKLSEQIREAARLLTSETWNQGRYFSVRSGHVCMCAHGAMQAVANERVRQALSNPRKEVAAADMAEAATAAFVAACAAGRAAAPSSPAMAAWAAWAAAAADAAESGAEAEAEAWTFGTDADLAAIRSAWERRPSWAPESSYMLGLVGLTAAWNDANGRTLDEVRAKFEEAAKLAEEIAE